MSLTISTALGDITLVLRPDAAPQTVEYIKGVAGRGLYNGKTFYRSDFVIQMGLHPEPCPLPNLPVNETHMHAKVSNTRGTAAVAHWDVPDCGNSEFFINLKSNGHLDSAYGGYCVFAEVKDDVSFTVVDAIANAVTAQGQVKINTVTVA